MMRRRQKRLASKPHRDAEASLHSLARDAEPRAERARPDAVVVGCQDAREASVRAAIDLEAPAADPARGGLDAGIVDDPLAHAERAVRRRTLRRPSSS